MMSFVRPDFTRAELEVREEKKEVAIYATPDGMRRLATLLHQLADGVDTDRTARTAHIHLEDQLELTGNSLRLVAAVFRSL